LFGSFVLEDKHCELWTCSVHLGTNEVFGVVMQCSLCHGCIDVVSHTLLLRVHSQAL
jgi:hypothetical protein